MRRKLFILTLFFLGGIVCSFALGLFLMGGGVIAAGVVLRCAGRMIRVEIRKLWAAALVAVLLGGLLLSAAAYRADHGSLGAYSRGEAAVKLQGKVRSVEKIREEKYRIYCTVDGEKLLCDYHGNLDDVWSLTGKEITFAALPARAEEAGNPRTFDYRLYLQSKGIFYVCTIEDFAVTGSEVWLIQRARAYILTKREMMMETLSLSAEAGGLIKGVLFGDTGELDEDVYKAFRQNGTAHVLAVSGLHVGMLYAIYRRLSKGKKSIVCQGIFLGLLFIYGTAALWSVSVTRAVLLILLKMLADHLNRRYDLLSALSAVACLAAIENPYVIFGASFQMSFLAVVSMTFLGPALERLFPAKALPGGVSMVLAVQMGLMPYMAYTFNYLSFVGILCNFPVVFLVSGLVPSGVLCFFLYLLIGMLPPFSAELLNGMAWLLIRVNGLFQADGLLSFDVVSPPIGVMVSIYGIMFFVSSEYFFIYLGRRAWKSIGLPLLLIGALAGGAACFAASPFDRASVVFVDVGQGDCLHLKWKGGTDILIDGGGRYGYNVGEKVLKPYLLKNGSRQIDLAVATHLHMDHYQGLTELAACFAVDDMLTAGKAGQRICLNEEQWIDILWPTVDTGHETSDAADLSSADENLHSMVFMVYDRGVRVLVTGDITEEGERMLLERYGERGRLKADVLKVAHHGSAYSTCDDFLAAVNPAVAVISVGKNNYGHPSNKVIEKMQKQGIMVFRTDQSGAVGIINRGGRISVCTKKQQ